MLGLLATLGPAVLTGVQKLAVNVGSELLTNWVKKRADSKLDAKEISEAPEEVREEFEKLTQMYLESRKTPVYMDGVIFFFSEEPDADTCRYLTDVIEMFEPEEGECTKQEYEANEFVNHYMGGENRKDNGDFGFEENTLYLNFTDSPDGVWLYDEKELRKFADVLNRLLQNNAIDNFVTF